MLFSHSCPFYFPFPPRTWEFTTRKQTLGNEEISVVISTHTTLRAVDLQQNMNHKLRKNTVQLPPPRNKTTPCKTHSLKMLSLQDTWKKLHLLHCSEKEAKMAKQKMLPFATAKSIGQGIASSTIGLSFPIPYMPLI